MSCMTGNFLGETAAWAVSLRRWLVLAVAGGFACRRGCVGGLDPVVLCMIEGVSLASASGWRVCKGFE